jgi:hypothetical protein
VLLRRSSLLAFHLGLDRVEGARLTPADAGFRPVEFATQPLPLGDFSETNWLAAVIPAWTALVREQKWRGRCALVLPGIFSLTRTIALPEGIFPSSAFGRGEFPAMDDLVAAHIPLPPETVVWSAIPLQAAREAVLAVAKVAVLQPLLSAAAGLGLEVEQVIPASLALYDGFGRLHPDREPSVVFVHEAVGLAQLVFATGATLRFRSVRVRRDTASRGLGAVLGEAVLKVIAAQAALPTQPVPEWIFVSSQGGNRAEFVRSLTTGGGVPVTEVSPESLREQNSEGPADGWVGFWGFGSRRDAGALTPGVNLLPPENLRLRKKVARLRGLLKVAAALVLLTAVPTASYYQRAREALALQDHREKERSARRREESQRQRISYELETARSEIAWLERTDTTNAAWLEFFAQLEAQVAGTECVWLDCFVLERAEATPVAGLRSGANRSGRRSEAGAKSEARVPASPRVRLSGRILDRTAGPAARLAPSAYARGQQLLARLRELPSVAAVAHERFEPGPDALLRFEVTLQLQPSALL